MVYRVRIIHSPLENRYSLEVKTNWWSSWNKVEEDAYRPVGKAATSYYPVETQLQLYERYRKRAEDLLSQTVVYESSRPRK